MKVLNQQIDYLSDMGKVIKAYEEIAAMRMQAVRKSVLKNREYTAELNRVFQIVKISYQKATEKYRLAGGRKNGKTVRIFLSTNTGLYGDMVHRVFSLFSSELRQSPSDAVVIGRLGKSLLESANPEQKFTYFEIPDREMILEEIQKITGFLLPYESVIVYHGFFKNILMQEAAATNISGDCLSLPEEKPATRKLIFEPVLPNVLSFFETEIFSGLLIHIVFESQLAKFSSRMSALEQASENIRRESLFARMELALQRKKVFDKKQREMLAGRSLWENK